MRTGSRSSWLAIPALLVACGGGQQAGEDGRLGGQISIDGSSTVYPISEAVAEEFMAEQGGGVRVTVGLSGTGGGFKRFCADETDISDASRPIKDSEQQICTRNQIDYLEIPIAYDGLTVAVNPRNTFVECLTVAELKKIWEPGSTVQRWSDIRAGFPNQQLKLYGPGTASGTFDYFTEAIVGKEDASRADYTASEDDNVLVQGVEGDLSALGYFGYAYYIENASRLKQVAIDGGAGCVQANEETVKGGTYTPLSRPLFIYVKRSALERPEVRAFVEYYIENARNLVGSVGYVALDDANYQESLSKLGPATPVEP